MKRTRSDSSRSRIGTSGAAVALLVVGGICGYAQYQVNMQLNTELYGRGVGTIRYNNQPFIQPALRSDYVHDTFLSGALPSDIRGAYLQQGPVAPYGVLSYVPNVTRPYGSYTTTLARGAPPPAASPYSTYGRSTATLPSPVAGGTVRYGTLGTIGASGVRQPYNAPRVLNLPGLTSPMSSSLSSGSLRYAR